MSLNAPIMVLRIRATTGTTTPERSSRYCTFCSKHAFHLPLQSVTYKASAQIAVFTMAIKDTKQRHAHVRVCSLT